MGLGYQRVVVLFRDLLEKESDWGSFICWGMPMAYEIWL